MFLVQMESICYCKKRGEVVKQQTKEEDEQKKN